MAHSMNTAKLTAAINSNAMTFLVSML